MKKLMLFNGKAMACLMLLCLLLAQGCKKEALLPNPKDFQNGISIAEARAYFDANLRKTNGPEKLMSTSGSGQSVEKPDMGDILKSRRALWDKAYQAIISTGSSVKVPLDFGPAYAIVNSKTRAVVPFGSLNYLFMYRDKQQAIHAEWVFLLPDSAWLYGKRANYSGNIMVKNWDGQTIKSFSYGSTKPAGAISALNQSKLGSLSPAAKTIMAQKGPITPICIEIEYYEKANETCSKERLATYGCDNCAVCTGKRTKTLCVWPVPDDTDGQSTGGGGGNGGFGDSRDPNQGGLIPGGSALPGDYIPPPCTDGQQMEYPDGSMTPAPCVPFPEDPPPPPINALQFLQQNLALNEAGYAFIFNPANNDAANEIAEYLITNGLTAENKEFVQWAVGYLMLNPLMSFEKLRSNLLNKPFDFEPSQELYIPRDKEPASYYWRPKLNNAANFDKYLSRTPDDTKPEDIVNCYYHAFGDVPDAIKNPGSPKHILQFKLGPEWGKVKNGTHIQVGDRIGYYVPNADGTKPAWAHAGVVTEVDKEGYATKITSKMGPYYEVIEHHPRDIPKDYGSTEPSFMVNGKPEASRIYWRKK